VLGPDGAVWFTEPEVWKIGRVTVEDGVTEFDVGARPVSITAGPDAAVWFCAATSLSTGLVVRFTPSGQRKDLSVPFAPMAITYGPDGNFWLTLYGGGIAKVTPDGVPTTYRPEGGTYQAIGVTAGPDGNVWFTEQFSSAPLADYVTSVTPSGDGVRHEIPNPPSGVVNIIEGPDHALWFTEYYRGVGRMTTTGALQEFPMAGTRGVVDLAFGPDGNLWATDYFNDHIVRMTPNGSLTYYSLPHPGSGANEIIAGADGAMWFTERTGNRVGRIAVGCQSKD
jgi:virginiamycin B lyase